MITGLKPSVFSLRSLLCSFWTYNNPQTSDFASALAGDDVEKMKKMQTAMQKGFKQATGAWGKDLPDICQKTLDAANQKFEDYYKSKKSTTKTEG